MTQVTNKNINLCEKTLNKNPMIIISTDIMKIQTLGLKKGSHINSMKFSSRLGMVLEPKKKNETFVIVPYDFYVLYSSDLNLSTCERVHTFFRQGCGITLGVQPWAIARKL